MGPDRKVHSSGGEGSSPVRIFVYGTLRRGEKRHFILRGCRFLGEATVKGFVLYDLTDYPGMVPGDMEVKGEVYEIPEELLKTLDVVEGTPDLYSRETIEVCLESGRKLRVLTYIYNGPTAGRKIIKSGDWKKRERV